MLGKEKYNSFRSKTGEFAAKKLEAVPPDESVKGISAEEEIMLIKQKAKVVIRAAFVGVALTSLNATAAFDGAKVNIGDAVTGPATFGERQLVIPVGEWHVMGKAQTDVTVRGETQPQPQKIATQQDLILVQVVNGKVAAMLTLSGTVNGDTTKVKRWTAEPCKQIAAYSSTILDNSYDYPRCTVLNHTVGMLATQDVNDTYYQVHANVEKAGWKSATNMLSARYMDFGRRGIYRVVLSIDPTIFGGPDAPITQARKEDWLHSPWHADNLDDAHRVWVSQFVAWSKDFTAAEEMARQGGDVQALTLPWGK